MVDVIAGFFVAFGLEVLFAGIPPGHCDGDILAHRLRDRMHPIALLGWYAQKVESVCFRVHGLVADTDRIRDRIGGCLAVIAVLGVIAVISWAWLALRVQLWVLPSGFAPRFLWVLATGILMMPMFATRLLYAHSARICRDLRAGDIVLARRHIRHLVGRDSASLGETRLVRATCESLAENFSDAVVAPALAAFFFGLPGVLVVKAINTLDSMWGYRSQRYRNFGWAAARLDDLVQYLPARISAVLLLISFPDNIRHLAAVMQHARRHASVNAGWPESAMAFVLGIRFGGRRSYPGTGKVVKTVWIGNGSMRATARDCNRALQIYCKACGVLVFLLVLVGFVLACYG